MKAVMFFKRGWIAWIVENVWIVRSVRSVWIVRGQV